MCCRPPIIIQQYCCDLLTVLPLQVAILLIVRWAISGIYVVVAAVVRTTSGTKDGGNCVCFWVSIVGPGKYYMVPRIFNNLYLVVSFS